MQKYSIVAYMRRSILAGLMLLIAAMAFPQEMTDSHINKSDNEGRKQGLWKVYDELGGLKYTGEYVDGKPVGTFTYYYPGGAVKALVVHDPDGLTIRVRNFHTNGKLMAEGKYLNQKKDSTWLYYSEEDGTLSAEELYSHTLREGVWKTFYPEGQVAEEMIYRNDIKEGPWTRYFTDGKVKMKATYINDKLEGQYIIYNLDGMVQVSGFYKNSEKDGTWVFFLDSGEMDKKEVYENGKLISQEIITKSE